jgi:hypothetical protein
MRKALGLVAVVVLTFGMAQAQKQTWNLSRDLRANGNQISFNQGSNGVWYFMESTSLKHNPLLYKFIPNYMTPCYNPNDPRGEKPIDGISCWRDQSYLDQHLPAVTVNFTNQGQTQLNFVIPAHAVFMHPAWDRFAIVAWKSPLNAIVRVRGAFTDIDPNCDNGILWSIDKGPQRLAFGDIPNGGAQDFDLPTVSVTKGQILYFIVDPKHGDYACDSTMIDLTIAETQ